MVRRPPAVLCNAAHKAHTPESAASAISPASTTVQIDLELFGVKFHCRRCSGRRCGAGHATYSSATTHSDGCSCGSARQVLPFVYPFL